MSATVSSLGNADVVLLTTGADVLSPTDGAWLILKATVNNQNASAQTVTAYRLVGGDTPGSTNIIIDALSIPPGETFALPLSGQPITANQVLHMSCSLTNAMVANIGYAIVLT